GLSRLARNDRGLPSEEEREQRRRVVAPIALAVIGPTIGITLVVIAAGRLRIIAAGRLRVIAAVVAVGARITGRWHRPGGVIVVLALVGRQRQRLAGRVAFGDQRAGRRQLTGQHHFGVAHALFLDETPQRRGVRDRQ